MAKENPNLRFESEDKKSFVKLSGFGISFGDKFNYNNKRAPKHVTYKKEGLAAELPAYTGDKDPGILLLVKKIDSWSSEKPVSIDNIMAAEGDLSDLLFEALDAILVYNGLKKIKEDDADTEEEGN